MADVIAKKVTKALCASTRKTSVIPTLVGMGPVEWTWTMRYLVIVMMALKVSMFHTVILLIIQTCSEKAKKYTKPHILLREGDFAKLGASVTDCLLFSFYNFFCSKF